MLLDWKGKVVVIRTDKDQSVAGRVFNVSSSGLEVDTTQKVEQDPYPINKKIRVYLPWTRVSMISQVLEDEV